MSKAYIHDDDGSLSEIEVADPIPAKAIPSEVEILKAQLKAQTDRCDFLEDCIAEMAMQVYN